MPQTCLFFRGDASFRTFPSNLSQTEIEAQAKDSTHRTQSLFLDETLHHHNSGFEGEDRMGTASQSFSPCTFMKHPGSIFHINDMFLVKRLVFTHEKKSAALQTNQAAGPCHSCKLYWCCTGVSKECQFW